MNAGLKERALRCLARRDHSRAELGRKLAEHGSAEEVEATLQRMEELGLLSDRRYAEAFVRSRQARFGQRRLELELARRGVDPQTAADAVSEQAGGDESVRAREIWLKKFGALPADRREWAKQARFLQNRGFSAEIIGKVLKDIQDESA